VLNNNKFGLIKRKEGRYNVVDFRRKKNLKRKQKKEKQLIIKILKKGENNKVLMYFLGRVVPLLKESRYLRSIIFAKLGNTDKKYQIKHKIFFVTR
jgi:hypothetical protein